MTKAEAREFLRNQVGNIYSAIRELTLAELKAIKNMNDSYSTTNCWFVEYHMKEGIANLLNDRISDFVSEQHNK